MFIEPKISVVCPTYNCERYIEKTLSALISQNHAPYEIIISDDSSKDNTVSLVRKYQPIFEEKGIIFTILENTHIGPGGARNRGIDAASGEWVAFLDADDIWHRNKLMRVNETINDNDDINFVIHWEEYQRLNGDKKILRHCDNYTSELPLEKQLYKSCMFSTSAVTVKRNLLNKVGGFDASLPSAQDYDLWLKLSSYIKLYILKEVLGYYIEVPTSITARPYYKRLWPLARIYWSHRDKASVAVMLYKLSRIILSREWITMAKNIILQKSSHA